MSAAQRYRRDAMRYRYLRSLPESVAPNRIDICYWEEMDEAANEGRGLRGDELDSYVDAAMKGETL